MSRESDQKARDFLAVANKFKLGGLPTETTSFYVDAVRPQYQGVTVKVFPNIFNIDTGTAADLVDAEVDEDFGALPDHQRQALERDGLVDEATVGGDLVEHPVVAGVDERIERPERRPRHARPCFGHQRDGTD